MRGIGAPIDSASHKGVRGAHIKVSGQQGGVGMTWLSQLRIVSHFRMNFHQYHLVRPSTDKYLFSFHLVNDVRAYTSLKTAQAESSTPVYSLPFLGTMMLKQLLYTIPETLTFFRRFISHWVWDNITCISPALGRSYLARSNLQATWWVMRSVPPYRYNFSQ